MCLYALETEWGLDSIRDLGKNEGRETCFELGVAVSFVRGLEVSLLDISFNK